jgi:hypothetical protein
MRGIEASTQPIPETFMKSIIAAAILAATASAAQAGEAAETVGGFYSAVEFEPDLTMRDLFIDPAKAKFEENDKLSGNGAEVGCIDFVLSIDAQDYDEKVLARTLQLLEEGNGDDATVTATFSLFDGQPDSAREIVWSLKNVDGDWKVSDIESRTNDWKLSAFDCN